MSGYGALTRFAKERSGVTLESTVAVPRCIIAAASSDCGKTTLTLGLIGAFLRRGLRIAAHKVGPDFIDAAHLGRLVGRPARNLDAFLAPAAVVQRSFLRGSADADVAIIEGVMGLFDGRHGTGEGSTAHIARILDAPVIVVLDCAKSSATVGAVAHGLATFDPRIRIAGAILNRVASDAQAATVIDAVRRASIPVFGVIRRDPRLTMQSRHLGLLEPGHQGWADAVAAAAEVVSASIDLDAILAAARSAAPLSAEIETKTDFPHRRVRVAIARDEAFWFYDAASLEALRDEGAELVEYSPLRDDFPEVDAAVIGGGYPELHASALAANSRARHGLRAAVEAGMPVYAECGGLLYLTQTLENNEGVHAMAAIVPARSMMSEKRSTLRYLEATAVQDGPMFARDTHIRGHEFHYSKTHFHENSPVFDLGDRTEGYCTSNIHASYVHVHLGAHPTAVRRFLERARAHHVDTRTESIK